MALKRGVVELEVHNSNWTKEYENEENILMEKLNGKVIEINHIGSTSIKGLMAKPIIDIIIVVDSINNIQKIEELETILVKLGYQNRGQQGVPDRIFFAKGPEDARTHYLHVTEFQSKTYYDQIYFKKYLLENPNLIKDYCELKKTLAKLYADDRPKYTAGKNEFITKVISLAKEKYGC